MCEYEKWCEISYLKSVVFCVKIGKNSPRNQPKTLIPQGKNKKKQNFFIAYSVTSYSDYVVVGKDFFRIKRAATSNYRGSVFLIPEFTPSVCSLALEFTLGVCLLACLPGAGGKKR